MSMVIYTDGWHDNIVNNNMYACMYLLTCELLFTQYILGAVMVKYTAHILMLFTLVEM